MPVEAADGVIDSLREKFVLDLHDLPPGEHLLVIRAADSANNTGLAKVVLHRPGAGQQQLLDGVSGTG